MAKTSTAKRIARLEGIAVGAGFLLQQLQASHGADFSEGMRIQVRDCIRDCRKVAASQAQRAESALQTPATQEQTHV